jgi:hypothetical protein
MMTCREIQLYLDDYLTNRLRPDFRTQIDEHLKSCEVCRVELEQTRIVMDMLAADKMPDPGDKYWDDVENDIMSKTFDKVESPVHKEPSRPVITFIKYAVSLAAVLAIFALSVVVSESGNKSVAEKNQDEIQMVSVSVSEIVTIDKGEIESELISSILLSTPGSFGQQGIILGRLGETGKDSDESRLN